MTPVQALERVKKAAKSNAQLARWAGCKRQAVSNWRKIPAERVLRLESNPAIGLTRYQMRSDVFGDAP